MLQGLDYADREKLEPVVDMERHPTRYSEEEPVHGVTNAWEYYFHQPGILSLAEALAQNPLDNGGDVSGPFTSNFHHVIPPADILARARELVRKYIRLKSHIVERLDAVIPVDAGRDMLGVHVRGTDMRKHRPPYHPAPNIPETYLEQAILLDQEFSYSRIFLACDEQETVALFQGQFRDRLLTLPAHRTSVDLVEIPREWSYAWLFDGERHHHRYLLGLEVLLDALLLSRCGHFACGASNVSQAAMYFASEKQIVHPITPLWMCPCVDRPSIGRAYLAEALPLSRKPSASVLEGQMHELYDLLEYAENSRHDAHQNMADMSRALTKADKRIQKYQQEIETLRQQIQKQTATIELLKNRISSLINRWTRLGWNLMPWKKPSWRSHPYK